MLKFQREEQCSGGEGGSIKMHHEIRPEIRPQNINWQDWKYTSFVIFIFYSRNIKHHSAMGRDKLVAEVVENIGLKIPISSRFSIHLFHGMTRKYLCRINFLNKIHIDVKHWIQ